MHAYNMGGWNGAICVASRNMLLTGRSLSLHPTIAPRQARVMIGLPPIRAWAGLKP